MQNLDFSVVTPYFGLLMTGLCWTLIMFVCSSVVSLVFGIAFALIVLYAPPIAAFPIRFLTWLFMGTPLLLQLYLIYYGLVQIGIDIPAVGNNLIVLLKDTSLVSIIGIAELVYSAQIAISETYTPFEFYLTIAGIYYVANLVLEAGLQFLENKVEMSR